MKRIAFLLLFLVSIMVTRASDELLQFANNHFDGWVYTQSSVEINNSNISNDRINLYLDYALISPEVTARNVKSVTVKVIGRTSGYEESEYNNTLGKVYVQLVNGNDSVLKEEKYKFKNKVLDRDFEVDFDISDIADESFSLRLACWEANIESRFSVRKVYVTVKEYNLSGVVGDVNNDGVVTSSDVTSLYDFLLSGDTSNIVNGDVNGDGSITSADVTEVYNILLGESLNSL